ncbi:MAG: hypothetical protein HQL82_07555 [Magnetococcales bacterium]|nr:hypothetical protein [Magnetococcales bacterium]
MSGCGGGEGEIDPQLFVNDGPLAIAQRYLMPETYWRNKLATLNADLAQAQAHWADLRRTYTGHLAKRREAIHQGEAAARASGQDPRRARQKAIAADRKQVNALRKDCQQAADQVRKQMQWQKQAQTALMDTLW